MTTYPWSAEEVDTLIASVARGMTGGEIARAMGRTRCSILGKASHMGLRLGVEAKGAVAPEPPELDPDDPEFGRDACAKHLADLAVEAARAGHPGRGYLTYKIGNDYPRRFSTGIGVSLIGSSAAMCLS